MPRIVLGAGGMLGRQFVEAIRKSTGVVDRVLYAWDRDELDITDAAAVRARFREVRPVLVINAAAYTNVDGAESSEREAHAINAAGAGNVAQACAEVGARLVHFSTDYVFDGTGDKPYREDHAAAPQSAYGRTKWAGEEAVRKSGANHLIVRTSWLFGRYGKNFVASILARARAGEPLRVVTDQVGSPTYTVDLVEAVFSLLEVNAAGTVHFANSGACSWHAFAREIVKQAGISAEIGEWTSRELNRPAPRPAYSALDTAHYTALTQQTPPAWPDALRRYLAEPSAN